MFVLLSVDVEPDRPGFRGKRYDYFGFQKWACLSRGMPEFLRIRHDLQKELETDIRLTWFLRSDSQIKMIYGNAAWAIEHFKAIIDKLQESRDEVGWHAHTWRWSENNCSWYQEINDEEWIESCYETGFKDFRKAVGAPPFSFRAGWCFHNNISIAMLDKLGIRVDLSAMPGIRNSGTRNTRDGSLYCGFSNWERTPTHPYHPSKKDYRFEGNDNYELLELPVTTVSKPIASYMHQILPFRVFGGLKLARPTLSLSKDFLSPTSCPLLFERNIKLVLRKYRKCSHSYLVLPFHADELLSITLMNNLLTNLRKVVSISRRNKIRARFITAAEAYSLCESGLTMKE
jgi:hypothetical protein